MTRSKLRALSWVGLALVVAAILLGTLTGAGGSGGGGGDCRFGLPCLLGHFLAFGALGVVAAVRFATSDVARRSPQRVLVMTVLAIWLFAGLDELAQGWVDGRDPSFEDWLADMVGAMLGLVLGSLGLRTLMERAGGEGRS